MNSQLSMPSYFLGQSGVLGVDCDIAIYVCTYIGCMLPV